MHNCTSYIILCSKRKNTEKDHRDGPCLRHKKQTIGGVDRQLQYIFNLLTTRIFFSNDFIKLELYYIASREDITTYHNNNNVKEARNEGEKR